MLKVKPEKAAFIILLVGVLVFLCLIFIPDDIVAFLAKRGPVADLFAGTFGAFATVGGLYLLYATYNTQKEELRDAKDQLSVQNAAIAKQKFESTFFQLLKLFRDQAKNTYRGLINIRVNIENKLAHNQVSIMISSNDIQTIIREAKELPDSSPEELSVYLRMLEYLLTFIDESTAITDEEKLSFAQLVETTMSEDELYVVFYECLLRGNNDTLTLIVKRRAFLDKYLKYRQRNISTLIREGFLA